ncbi:uncharacterized protein LOC117816051 [Xyrichtys novacula]|uniref:Uncharacterized protein LOC117816051 n=1 Tax=Xyrichtys novacula TaxID=13765 RepID=A0AAV1EY36_XYRNO|nr:uncharacterized protein LOC117816051 [Xyrichtys novacula]
MPQNNMNYEGRRRGECHSFRKANAQVNGHFPGTDLVNGAVFRNSCPAAAMRTSERTHIRAENSVRPQGMVNGYFNHEWRGFGGRAAQPSTSMRQRGTVSAVTDAPAYGRTIRAGVQGGVSVTGNTVSLHCDSDQMKPKLSLRGGAKNRGRWMKFKNKRRDSEVNRPKIPTPILPQEDWEKEITEVTVADRKKMSSGIDHYDPEDLLDDDLRILTLKQLATVPPSMRLGYCPAVHHPRSLHWSCYLPPPDPDLFADADD